MMEHDLYRYDKANKLRGCAGTTRITLCLPVFLLRCSGASGAAQVGGEGVCFEQAAVFLLGWVLVI